MMTKRSSVNQETLIDNSGVSSSPLDATLSLPSSEMLHLLVLPQENIELNYPFQSTFGNTIVHCAAGDGRISKENLKLFLSRLVPADTNARDSIGKTSLHNACWILPTDYEAKMLRAGANVYAFDPYF